MAEYSRFFGGPEGDVPEYTQPQFAEVLEKLFSNGVFTDVDDELAVSENDPVSLSVIVASGEGWINGFWYQNTEDLTKTLGAADPDNPRIDRIILRLDTTDDFEITCEVLEGTPGADPDPPELTQTAATYEISLCQVLVAEDATSVDDEDITDEREYAAVPEADNADTVDGIHGTVITEQSTIWTSSASSATPTPARASVKTGLELTALAAAAELQNPTGTPVNGDMLFVSITDNGTGRALTYDTLYDDPYSATLPTTTVANLTILMLFMYSTARTKWELLYEDSEA